MSAAVRRLLLAALAVGSFVVIGAAPAQAECTCTTSTTLMESIKAADAVFTGTVGNVTVAENPGEPDDTAITNSVAVDRVYKGRVDAPDQLVGTTRRTQVGCGLGQLKSGARYVFIVQAIEVGDTEATWFDDGCSGTRLESDAVVAQIQGKLGRGEPTVAPEQPAAVLTDVDTSEPTTLSRAAAPGAALVLIGLLGLVLVRRLNARRTP